MEMKPRTRRYADVKVEPSGIFDTPRSNFLLNVEQGLRLYNQHKQQAAVTKWRSALKRIRKRSDKFILLGYLYQAYMDWGKYRSAFIHS
ncbi:unnamed protein product [Nezara viridula]|uniref:Rapsyn myristoylation/linker region N-terminal domain-containing protein n=1 Tax=Nezara viridula TaxID=85310 RepID=A0A9P0MLV6_NEZVI|nr:unnamed protein product [Nezara viridula]